jgi:WD40 repeat protein
VKTSELACFALLALSAAKQNESSTPDIHYTLPISHMVFSPDAKLLATSYGWKVGVWTANTAIEVHQFKLKTTDGPVIGLRFSFDNNLLYRGHRW